MTIGTGTYDPGEQFYTPRSYVTGIYIATYLGNTVAGGDDFYHISAVPPDPTFAIIKLDPIFATWNSNKRSLDHIVKEFYYEVPPSTVQHPLDFTLSFINDPPHHSWALKFEWAPFSPTFQYFRFLPQAFGYWLPRPLP